MPLSDLISPPRCPLCERSCAGGERLCGPCAGELALGRPAVEAGPPGITLAVSAAPYEGAARALVLRLKYGRRLQLAAAAAEAMLAACPDGLLAGELVPVPAAPLRRLWRGFDPAEEIGLALASLAGTRLCHRLRRRDARRQVGRPRALRLGDPPRVRARGRAPARVVLVDDVRTSGATLASCAAILRAAGAERVDALTFARSR